jgi:hypothetical protein
MSVSGIIERDELATALRLVSRGRGTGVLVASTAYANASVAFRDGEILRAGSSAGPTLGDVLVEAGAVSREKLDAALWVQRQDKVWRPLGRVLLDVRLVPLSVVEAAVEAQITRVLDAILRWDRGTFRFEPGPPPPGDAVLPPCRDLGQYEVRIAILRAGELARDGSAA